MELTAYVLIGLIGGGIAVLVGFVSRTILARQEQFANNLQQMAGIQSIEWVEEETPFTSFAQVLEEHEPRQQLNVLATSGVSLLSEGEDALHGLLNRGVSIRIMLIDPNSDSNWLAKEYDGMSAIKDNLSTLRRIAKSTQSPSGQLEIRLYPQPVLENLMFVDGDRLFISSYLPSLPYNRLIYEVRKGEQSLYNLYRPAFDFVWRYSYPPSQE